MKRFLFLCALIAITAGSLQAQAPTTDVIGVHDMGPFGQSPITGGLPTCQYCHAPHSGLHNVHPLWSQKLSTTNNYTLYSTQNDPNLVNATQQPALGSASNLCLSCHDGTVAPGQTTPYGKVRMNGAMQAQDVFGTNLTGVHPFNFQYPVTSSSFSCTDNLSPSFCLGITGNPAVKLVSNNVQCTTCHEPHVQNIDPVAGDFLVMNNAGSALCLTCHISAPTATPSLMAQRRFAPATGARGISASSRVNTFTPFSFWTRSIHGQAVYKVAKGLKLGPYGNTKQNGCQSCHAPHNAPGAATLLTGPPQPVPNMDSVTQNCISCHNGGSNISPALPSVFAEFAKTGHPFPTGSNKHSATEGAVLNNNRHATCVDCHDPHASQQTSAFTSTPLRGSQNGVIGVSAVDGTSVLTPAVNQYETCFRCHGTSTGKQMLAIFGYLPTRAVSAGDPLNLVPQFSTTAASSHPVTHDSNSALPQPSLRAYMLNLDGHTQGRAMGTRVLCTDCHNADDNREFGGAGPNGPHGSQYQHILERRYEFSQVAPGVAPTGGPGTSIRNLQPAIVDPAAGGPYSLCAKCHDLGKVLSNTSFNQHASHINAGFSCSVCHTAHGMNSSGSISGARLVNFDLAVVAPNDSSNAPISYNRGTNTCTLKCHNFDHNANGTINVAGAAAVSTTAGKGRR